MEVDPNGGAAEMARLAALSSAKVLNVTNVPSLATYDLGWKAAGKQGALLTKAQADAFRSKFEKVIGSWCCAPKGGKPRDARFSLWRAA